MKSQKNRPVWRGNNNKEFTEHTAAIVRKHLLKNGTSYELIEDTHAKTKKMSKHKNITFYKQHSMTENLIRFIRSDIPVISPPDQ